MSKQPLFCLARGRQAGVSLIEVLVAILIISIGVLGYAGLQLRALNSTEHAHYMTQATALAQDVVERVAANPQQFATYANPDNWDQTLMGETLPSNWNACLGTGADCTPAQMAESDILQARWFASQMLPNGTVLGEECEDSMAFCITVAWSGQSAEDCTVGSANCVLMEAITWATN